MDFNELHRAGHLYRRRETILSDIDVLSHMKEDLIKPYHEGYGEPIVSLGGISLVADDEILEWFEFRLQNMLKEINEELRKLGVDIPE